MYLLNNWLISDGLNIDEGLLLLLHLLDMVHVLLLELLVIELLLDTWGRCSICSLLLVVMRCRSCHLLQELLWNNLVALRLSNTSNLLLNSWDHLSVRRP